MKPLVDLLCWLVILALAAPVPLRAAPSAPSGQELLQKLARIFPATTDAAAERRYLERIATGGDLTGVEVKTLQGSDASGLEPALRAPGIAADLHELSATGDEIAVVMTLPRLYFFPRPAVVESAEIVPVGGRQARLVARVAFPALDPTRISDADLLALADRVNRRPAWVTALVGIDASSRGLPVRVTHVRFDPGAGIGVELEALTVGRATPEAFRHALLDAGVGDPTLRSTPHGRCIALAVTGRLPTTEGDELDVSGGLASSDLLQTEAETPCGVPPATTPVRVEARGAGSGRTATIRARSAGSDDLLFLLEAAFGQPTAGPGASSRSFDLALQGTTLDETLGALDRAGAHLIRFGDAVLGPGAAPGRAPDTPYSGDPISGAFHCAEITDLLQLFGRISGLEFRPAADVGGCVDLYATSRPWDAIVDASFAAAGLAYRIEGTTVHVSRAAGATLRAEATSSVPSPSDPRWHPKLERLSVEDLRLFALLEQGGVRRAFAHGPLGGRYELVPGTRLLDARVEATDERGVTLSAGRRSLRMDLP